MSSGDITYEKLHRYILAHTSIRTLLVKPEVWLQIVNLVSGAVQRDLSGEEFIQFHWVVVRPKHIGIEILVEDL